MPFSFRSYTSSIGKPFSAISAAGSSRSASFSLPCFFNAKSYAASAPGTPEASAPVLLASSSEHAAKEIHIPMRRRRGHLAPVDARYAAIRRSNQHKAPAAEARIMPVHHAQGQSRRNRRIHRIAAPFERMNPASVASG